MAEYIKKQDAVNCLWTNCDEVGSAIVSDIEAIPAADVRPVVYGKWIYKKKLRGGFSRVAGVDDDGNTVTVTVDSRHEIYEPYCSECRKWNDGSNMDFCGLCGADMRPRRAEEQPPELKEKENI